MRHTYKAVKPAARTVPVTFGQYGLTCVGQYVAGLPPIQKDWPAALMGWPSKGLPGSEVVTLKIWAEVWPRRVMPKARVWMKEIILSGDLDAKLGGGKLAFSIGVKVGSTRC